MSDARASVCTGGSSDSALIAVVLPTPTGPVKMILFSIICNTYKKSAWKSKLHYDGTMYDDYFIVGLFTPEGDFTYHYHIDHWDMFDVIEINRAPEWDGHKPEDIVRLISLLK